MEGERQTDAATDRLAGRVRLSEAGRQPCLCKPNDRKSPRPEPKRRTGKLRRPTKSRLTDFTVSGLPAERSDGAQPRGRNHSRSLAPSRADGSAKPSADAVSARMPDEIAWGDVIGQFTSSDPLDDQRRGAVDDGIAGGETSGSARPPGACPICGDSAPRHLPIHRMPNDRALTDRKSIEREKPFRFPIVADTRSRRHGFLVRMELGRYLGPLSLNLMFGKIVSSNGAAGHLLDPDRHQRRRSGKPGAPAMKRSPAHAQFLGEPRRVCAVQIEIFVEPHGNKVNRTASIRQQKRAGQDGLMAVSETYAL